MKRVLPWEVVLSVLPSLSHEQIQDRIVYRDVAQRLMARFLGLETGAIEVKMTFDRVTGTDSFLTNPPTCLNSTSKIAEYINKRLLVLSAGVMGEMEWYETILGINIQQEEAEEIYENGALDDSLNSNKSKIKELLVVLAGLRLEPCNCINDFETQNRDLFSQIYEHTREIFITLREKFLTLSGLVISEEWNNGLLVTAARLDELECIVDAQLSIENNNDEA